MSTTDRTHRMDEQIVTNQHGGSQSKIDFAPRLVPGEALIALEPYFEQDLVTGKMPWRDETVSAHANRALKSLNRLLDSSVKSDLHEGFAHIVKAICVEDQHGDEAFAAGHVAAQPSSVPPEAYLRIAEVTGAGVQKYGENNWRLIHYTDQVDHAITHLLQWFMGDRSDDHLGHCLTRLSFAVAMLPAEGWDFKAVRKVNAPTSEQSNAPSAADSELSEPVR